jgi:hypothetical protein
MRRSERRKPRRTRDELHASMRTRYYFLLMRAKVRTNNSRALWRFLKSVSYVPGAMRKPRCLLSPITRSKHTQSHAKHLSSHRWRTSVGTSLLTVYLSSSKRKNTGIGHSSASYKRCSKDNSPFRRSYSCILLAQTGTSSFASFTLLISKICF